MSSAFGVRSSRFIVRPASALLLRPTVATQRLAPILANGYATNPEPKTKAASLISSLPENALSKTGLLATGALSAVYAISNELYIVNEETCMLAVFSAFIFMISKIGAPAYTEWANGYIANIKATLNKSRVEHTAAIKERIESVGQLKDVVDTTKALFEISKETAVLESKAFELKQTVEFTQEAKSVLDSWVRYEASVRQREQKQLAEAVIAKIQREISTPKFQQQYLTQSVSEVEKLFNAAK
ncbi:ATP4 subunit B of the stator stalk of mitochondrial F1F0 ATP synthase-like protein [Lipomyces arxii]|uniref:ATP4 subunit B of the stator stalk of mitochondrial F1F0 ATP synthase-like protein n=1 Tax=Lipomyces arxii TaxID=56418 RepID=UPI0034CF540A